MCHLLGPSFGLALQSSIVFLGLWWHQISEPNQLSSLKGHWFQLPPNIWRLMTYPEKSDFSPKSWSIEHICHPSSLPFLRSLALMRVEIGFLMRCWCSIATFEFWHEFHLIVSSAATRLPAYFCSQWASVNPILEWQISHLTGSR